MQRMRKIWIKAFQKKGNIGQKDILCFQNAECEIKYEKKKQQSKMGNKLLNASRQNIPPRQQNLLETLICSLEDNK